MFTAPGKCNWLWYLWRPMPG